MQTANSEAATTNGAMRVLVADDEPSIRFVLAESLEALGHAVARTRTLPTPGLALDPHRAVRRFWEALGGA